MSKRGQRRGQERRELGHLLRRSAMLPPLGEQKKEDGNGGVVRWGREWRSSVGEEEEHSRKKNESSRSR